MSPRTRTLALLALALLAPPGARPAAPGRTPAGRPDEPLPAGAVLRLGTARFRYEGFSHRLAFSPDGRTLAGDRSFGVFSADALCLWDVHTGKEVRCFPPPGGRVGAFAFSPDGKALACGGKVG